jgi:uncharacterized membrane protein YfcA
VAGLLGVGGAIVMIPLLMIPLLLYVPPLLGVEALGVKAVSGVTMIQVLVASVSGVLAHRQHRAVHHEVAWVGGSAMAAGSLAGAFASSSVPDRWLLAVFAVMTTGAGLLMLVPDGAAARASSLEPQRFSRLRTVLVSGTVGVAGGLVGTGGAFLLVPLLLVVVGVPIRATVGSSLAITAIAAMAGSLGKIVTGQIPYGPAALVAVGAAVGAQIGAAASRRLSGAQLRGALSATIAAIAGWAWWGTLVR